MVAFPSFLFPFLWEGYHASRPDTPRVTTLSGELDELTALLPFYLCIPSHKALLHTSNIPFAGQENAVGGLEQGEAVSPV